MVQFLKPLAFYGLTEYNFPYRKEILMSKRIYHLTIEYDHETEEIEYIMESVDEDSLDIQVIGEVNLAEYFDEAVLKLIGECYEVGEA